MKKIERKWWPEYVEEEHEIDLHDILYALDSAAGYNGLSRYIQEWKNIPENPYGSYWPIYSEQAGGNSTIHDQLQIFWMIAVELFGECGTSPRSGWIEKENLESFHEWIDEITMSQTEEDLIEAYCASDEKISYEEWLKKKALDGDTACKKLCEALGME